MCGPRSVKLRKSKGNEAVIRTAVFRSLLLGLFLFGCASTDAVAAGSTPGAPSRTECIREGLAPISVNLHVSVRGQEASIPFLGISWTGVPPIPAACGLERTVGADVEVRFAKYPKEFSFSSGFPHRWLVFLGSRQTKGHGRTGYEGPTVEEGSLGCIRSVRARLRYRVLAPGHVVVARRVRSTPAHYSSCAKTRVEQSRDTA
jgi:hypothetical protein